MNKSLCRYYNEGHHGKFPMDDEGETIKNVIFRKGNSCQIVVHNTRRISDAAMKFEYYYCEIVKSDEIVEPVSIHQALSIPETLSVHKFV